MLSRWGGGQRRAEGSKRFLLRAPGVVLAEGTPQDTWSLQHRGPWALLGHFPSSEAPGNFEQPLSHQAHTKAFLTGLSPCTEDPFRPDLKGLLSLAHPPPATLHPCNTSTQRRPHTEPPLDYFIHMIWQDTGAPAKEPGTATPDLPWSVAHLPAF